MRNKKKPEMVYEDMEFYKEYETKNSNTSSS